MSVDTRGRLSAKIGPAEVGPAEVREAEPSPAGTVTAGAEPSAAEPSRLSRRQGSAEPSPARASTAEPSAAGPAAAPAEPTPRGLSHRQVRAVAACYFVASFAALGLPPYLTQILPTLGDQGARWAGVLYVVPTVFSAVGAPVWGWLADRFGRKRMLLRAQVGLSVAFLVAGSVDSLGGFALALVLQGFLGGTFAATNGYLGAALEGPQLSRALTLTQGAARAALVVAPILVGALTPWVSPHRQYLVLAVLPLGAAGLLARMPEPSRSDAEPRRVGAGTRGSLGQLYIFEFLFVFATIVSFPYLLALVQQRVPGIGGTVAGAVFALPHLVYLLSAGRIHAAVVTRPRGGLLLGFVLVALGLVGHWPARTLTVFVLARLVLGAGLTLGLVCLSVLTAEAARGRRPGRMFGTYELVSKAGAVAAGGAAALVGGRYGAAAPLLTGTAAALAAALLALLTRRSHR